VRFISRSWTVFAKIVAYLRMVILVVGGTYVGDEMPSLWLSEMPETWLQIFKASW